MLNPQKILIVQLKRAGDVIVTTPVLPALRAALPGAVIDFLVDKPFSVLLENHPDLRHLVLYERGAPWRTWKAIRQEGYDWILDFQSSPRSVLAGLWSGARVRAGYRVPFWGWFFTHSMQRPGGDITVTEGKMNLVKPMIAVG